MDMGAKTSMSLKYCCFFAIAVALITIPSLSQASCSGGDYTKAQAKAGERLFNANCASCHMTNLQGGSGPALTGPKFKSYLDFTKISGDQLFSFIKSQMPYQAPGSLAPKAYEEIFSYILGYNGYPAGKNAFDPKTASCVKMLPFPGKT